MAVSNKKNPITNRESGGFTIWLTGLAASGKSTLADNLHKVFLEKGIRSVVLDGDDLRKIINSDLKFSIADREENNRRAAGIAKIINNSGIITICSFISPTEKIRENIKQIIGDGKFILVFMDTPMEICEQRDKKLLYHKARLGIIKDFSGISSEFEVPSNPAIILNGLNSVKENISQLLLYLNLQ